MVKYDYIMHCSHPVKCTLQKPCGLFSCAKSRDGGVTTRSLFIYPPGYDAWCNQQGASLLHHSQTAGGMLGWCTEANMYHQSLASQKGCLQCKDCKSQEAMAQCMLFSFVLRRDKSYFICHISVSFTSRLCVDGLPFLIVCLKVHRLI